MLFSLDLSTFHLINFERNVNWEPGLPPPTNISEASFPKNCVNFSSVGRFVLTSRTSNFVLFLGWLKDGRRNNWLIFLEQSPESKDVTHDLNFWHNIVHSVTEELEDPDHFSTLFLTNLFSNSRWGFPIPPFVLIIPMLGPMHRFTKIAHLPYLPFFCNSENWVFYLTYFY